MPKGESNPTFARLDPMTWGGTSILKIRDSPCTVKNILAVLCGVVDTWQWHSPSSDARGFFSRTTQSSECGRWKASNLCAQAWLIRQGKNKEARNQSSFTAHFYRPATLPFHFNLTLGGRAVFRMFSRLCLVSYSVLKGFSRVPSRGALHWLC